MPKKRYTEEQIGFVPHQAEAGTPVEAVCHNLGVVATAFYRARPAIPPPPRIDAPKPPSG